MSNSLDTSKTLQHEALSAQSIESSEKITEISVQSNQPLKSNSEKGHSSENVQIATNIASCNSQSDDLTSLVKKHIESSMSVSSKPVSPSENLAIDTTRERSARPPLLPTPRTSTPITVPNLRRTSVLPFAKSSSPVTVSSSERWLKPPLLPTPNAIPPITLPNLLEAVDPVIERPLPATVTPNTSPENQESSCVVENLSAHQQENSSVSLKENPLAAILVSEEKNSMKHKKYQSDSAKKKLLAKDKHLSNPSKMKSSGYQGKSFTITLLEDKLPMYMKLKYWNTGKATGGIVEPEDSTQVVNLEQLAANVTAISDESEKSAKVSPSNCKACLGIDAHQPNNGSCEISTPVSEVQSSIETPLPRSLSKEDLGFQSYLHLLVNIIDDMSYQPDVLLVDYKQVRSMFSSVFPDLGLDIIMFGLHVKCCLLEVLHGPQKFTFQYGTMSPEVILGMV
jgi:hypothetical protein